MNSERQRALLQRARRAKRSHSVSGLTASASERSHRGAPANHDRQVGGFHRHIVRLGVVALVRDPLDRSRIEQAAGHDADVFFVATTDELLRVVERRHPQVAIVEPSDADANPSAPIVGELVRRFPSVAVVAYCDTSKTTEIVALIRAGASELVLHDTANVTTPLMTALQHARTQRIVDRILDAARDVVSTEIYVIVRIVVTSDDEIRSVESVAQALGVESRTLDNWTTRVGAPTPHRVVVWARLTLAIGLLEDPGRRIEEVALSRRRHSR